MLHGLFRILRMRIVAVSVGAIMFINAAASAPPLEGERVDDDRPLQVELIGGASWSDNVARVPVNEEDGTVGRAGILLGYGQKTRRIEASIDANAAYEHYFDDAFDDDVVGGVNGLLDIGIVPEHFRWFAQDNFGQIVSNPFAATTPDNLENINYFTTGPDFILRLGSANSLEVSGRFSDTQYETSNLDSQQYGGAVALAHELSDRSTLSLNVTGDRTKFDDTVANADYDRYQAFLRLAAQGARTSLSVDAGYTTLDLGSQTSSGILARLAVARRLSPASTLSLSGGTQFSDSGDLFRDVQSRRSVSLEASSVVGSSDPFVSRFGSIGYEFSRNRTTFGFVATYSKEEYETVRALDRNLTYWDAHFARQLSRVLEMRIFVQLEQERFDTANFDDDELRAGAYLSWSVGRTVSLRLQYDRMDRDSSDTTTDYTENEIGLFVTWSPIGRQ